jgi:hypothetical protein
LICPTTSTKISPGNSFSLPNSCSQLQCAWPVICMHLLLLVNNSQNPLCPWVIWCHTFLLFMHYHCLSILIIILCEKLWHKVSSQYILPYFYLINSPDLTLLAYPLIMFLLCSYIFSQNCKWG